MANYKRIAAGNISNLAQWEVWNGSAWVAASTLPTTGDVCYANGFNSVINQNWTVAEIRQNTFQGTTANGRFELLSAGITFDGDRYSSVASVPILYVSFGGGTSSVMGEGFSNNLFGGRTLSILGQAGGILNLENSGTADTGTELTGNGAGFIVNIVNISSNSTTEGFGLKVTGNNYVVNHSGTGIIGSGNGAHGILVLGSNNRLVLTGQGTGPAFAQNNTTAFLYCPGLANEIVLAGTLTSTAFGYAVMVLNGTYTTSQPSSFTTTNTSWVTLGDGATLIGTAQFPAVIGKIRVDDGAGVQWLTKSPTTANVYLYTASELTGYPLESKVEDGTVYGPSSEFEGTLLPWDSAFAQALATAQRDLQLPSILSAITAP